MKFSLDALIVKETDDAVVSATELESAAELSAEASDLANAEGRLVAHVDGADLFGDFTAEPIVRLVDGWLRKLPWIIGGDTETVALRNSEQCFAFVPTGESVEITFFVGTEAEIEDYVTEPTVVRLELFVQQTLAVGQRLVRLLRRVDEALLESNEDCRDLLTSLTEAERAWHDHELHNRR